MTLISGSGGWRTITARWVPWWFQDRVEDGLVVGYLIWWVIGLSLDWFHQFALEGIYASWPGFGTPTSLALIGRSRGMIRGMSESDKSFAARLVQWKQRWRRAGSLENLVQGFHEYVLGNPPCFIVNRKGTRVSIASDGTMTKDVITWDWDSLSNPERANFWSELWIVVFAPPWSVYGSALSLWPWGEDDPGYGHTVSRVDADAIKGMLQAGPTQHSAHSFVRAIVWCYDDTLFDSTNSATMPDGTWGEWIYPTRGFGYAANQSGRFASCRFWEPEVDPNQ